MIHCTNEDCNEPLVTIGHNGAAQVSGRHFFVDGEWYCDDGCYIDWMRKHGMSCYDPRFDPDIGDMA